MAFVGAVVTGLKSAAVSGVVAAGIKRAIYSVVFQTACKTK